MPTTARPTTIHADATAGRRPKAMTQTPIAASGTSTTAAWTRSGWAGQAEERLERGEDGVEAVTRDDGMASSLRPPPSAVSRLDEDLATGR